MIYNSIPIDMTTRKKPQKNCSFINRAEIGQKDSFSGSPLLFKDDPVIHQVHKFDLGMDVAKAILWGLVTRKMPFFRTPKLAPKMALLQAIIHAWQETALLAAFLGAAVGVHLRQTSYSFDLKLWIVVLVVQAIPYAAALIMSVISGMQHLPAKWMRVRRPLKDPEEL